MSVLEKLNLTSHESPPKVEFPEAEFDPAPDQKPAKKPARTSGSARSRAALRRDIEAEITGYLKVLALTWSLRDETCAEVLSEQSQAIASSLVDVLADHPRALAWFSQGTQLAKWVRLGHAMLPVVVVVRAHHLSKDSSSTAEGATDASDNIAAYPPLRFG